VHENSHLLAVRRAGRRLRLGRLIGRRGVRHETGGDGFDLGSTPREPCHSCPAFRMNVLLL
jgi:hypothetical protein